MSPLRLLLLDKSIILVFMPSVPALMWSGKLRRFFDIYKQKYSVGVLCNVYTLHIRRFKSNNCFKGKANVPKTNGSHELSFKFVRVVSRFVG